MVPVCGGAMAGKNMLQLIYVSIAHDTHGGDLRALCAQASRNNVRDEITGVMLIDGGYYLQVLEGPKETVENTFLRIIQDKRHHGLTLLSRRLVTSRHFGTWAMATCQDVAAKQAVIHRVRDQIDAAPHHAQRTFERFFD
jgi:hypothetical protein